MAGPWDAAKLAEFAKVLKDYLERASLGAASSLKKLAEKVPDSAATLEMARKIRSALGELLERLQQSEALGLIEPRDATSLAAVLRNGKSHVGNFLEEFLQLPPATALAVLAVSLRSVSVLTRLGYAAAREVLQMLIRRWRSTLVVAATPGFLILRRHRQQILKDFPPSPLQMGLSQACLQLASNLRPFPPVFWVSAASTALLTLQAMEVVGLWAVANGSRFRRTIFAATLVVLLAAKSAEARKALRERAGQLVSAEALSEMWIKTRSLLVDLGHALRVAVAPKATPRRVPPGAELVGSPKHQEEASKLDVTMQKVLLQKVDAEIRPPVFGGSQ